MATSHEQRRREMALAAGSPRVIENALHHLPSGVT
jgi:hypothetical protein